MTLRPITSERGKEAALLGEKIFDACLGYDVSLTINALVGVLGSILINAAVNPYAAVEEVCLALARGVADELNPPGGETLQ